MIRFRMIAAAATLAALAASSAQAQFGPPGGWNATPPVRIRSAGGRAPSGLTPAQVRHAYGFDQLTNDGTGQTIAIVDAYDAPNIASDLAAFCKQFGLPAPGNGWTFTKATPQGKPRVDGGWALEISLDVEWAHAVAPKANILLVEAKSASFSNLLSAVDYASARAQVVSMSWGGSEFSGETSYNSHFVKSGVSFFAASGDNGAGTGWPAAASTVVGVGGTLVKLDSSNNITSETGWSGSGGGVSSFYGLPGYQAGAGLSFSGRAMPDVSYNGDPNSGVAVYDSTLYQGYSGWWVVGGTSAGTPQWAAIFALANQKRTSPITDGHSALYSFFTSAYATDYRDITSGGNSYGTKVGFDLTTGIGSPLGAALVPALTASP